MTCSIPQPFPGTEEEAMANMGTHLFSSFSDRCDNCDCRPWGTYARYPCGAKVPRIDVESDSPEGRAAVLGMSLGAAVYSALKAEQP